MEVDVEAELSAALSSGGDLGETIAALGRNSAALDKELRKQISSHHEKLLKQAMSIESLEEILASLEAHMAALTSVAQRTASKSRELFAKTQLRTEQLQRLHETCNILRALIRVFVLSAKLHAPAAADSSRDMLKRSEILAELAELTAETDLRGIAVVEKELLAFPRLRKELKEQAGAALRAALPSGNQATVGAAVASLANVAELGPELEELLAEKQAEISRRLHSLAHGERKTPVATAATASRPGGAAMPAMPNAAAVRAHLWDDVHALAALLAATHGQVATLHSVIVKKPNLFPPKKDSEEPRHLVGEFWGKVAEMMRKEFGEKVGLVKQTLEGEYPKLLRQVGDLIARIAATDAVAPDPRRLKAAEEVRRSLGDLETAYLSKSLGHMFETVNMAFGEDAAPTDDELSRMGHVFLNELQVAGFDAALCSGVGKNIVKTIKLFGVKAEQLINTNKGDASQVIGPANVVQRRNINVINALFRFSQIIPAQVEKVRGSASPEVLGDIVSAGSSLGSVISGGVEPLLSSLADSVSAILETMHAEDWGRAEGGAGSEATASPYMRELQDFLSRVSASHLSAFASRELVAQLGAAVARGALQSFLLHASLIRPISDGGRCRLAADCAQMELALSPLCPRLAALGPDYVALRALRPLFFLSPKEIAEAPVLGAEVPWWLGAQLIIQASELELSSPHETAGWSISRYSEWMAQHESEVDRLQFLRGALDAYAQKVAGEGRTQYAPTYPILLDLLQKAAANAKK